MSYISAIFKRADIQHIREYLLNGGELLQVDHTSYEQRLEDGMEQAIQMIQTYLPNQEEEMENHLIKAVSAYKDVYMEIGLQVGISLGIQLFSIKR